MTLFSFSAAEALQCVPYARQESGLELRGNAWTWWGNAAAKYERGNLPQVGSVLVFKKGNKMRYGHVAVVSDIIDSRKILVDHANWGRGRARGKITRNAEVIDTSPNNDWSSVKVWYAAINDMGQKNYPTYGFIYPSEAPDEMELIQASLDVADALSSMDSTSSAGMIDDRDSSADDDPWASVETPRQGNLIGQSKDKTGTTTLVSLDDDIASVSPAAGMAEPEEEAVVAPKKVKKTKAAVSSKKKKGKTTVTAKKKVVERPGSIASREALTEWKAKVVDTTAKKPLVKTKTVAKRAPKKKKTVKK